MKLSNKIIGLTAGILFTVSAYASVTAQDFYNGFRGPRAFQIDNYVNHTNGTTTGLLVSKIFTKNLNSSLSDVLLAVPFTISETKTTEHKGFNIGYIVESKSNSGIGAIGFFRDDDGDYASITPQIYFTRIKEQWTFDVEGKIAFNRKSHEVDESASFTVGYGVNDRVRLGISATKETGKDLDCKAIIRFELSKDHKYWTQMYVGENSIGFRLALNF